MMRDKVVFACLYLYHSFLSSSGIASSGSTGTAVYLLVLRIRWHGFLEALRKNNILSRLLMT